MKIVVDSDIPFISGILESFAEVVYMEGWHIANSDLRDADALIVRTRTRCDRQLLENTSIRFIATATIGFDHIDTDYCRDRGITVSSSAGCNARAVLQWVGAALAALSHKDGWQPSDKTLGVVGVGNVGSLIADYGRNWGFRVLVCDPPRQRREGGDFVTLDRIASEADIITFHTPLNRNGADKTLDMAGDDFFGAVGKDAAIINSSRGEVIDEAAFKRAIRSKDLTAVIDTWRNEPNIDRGLLDMAYIATQHIAGYSLQGKAEATAMAVNALSSFFGLPLGDWYPDGVPASSPRDIFWSEMTATIGNYINLAELTSMLKSDPASFEYMRSSYQYRCEYF